MIIGEQTQETKLVSKEMGTNQFLNFIFGKDVFDHNESKFIEAILHRFRHLKRFGITKRTLG